MLERRKEEGEAARRDLMAQMERMRAGFVERIGDGGIFFEFLGNKLGR